MFKLIKLEAVGFILCVTSLLVAYIYFDLIEELQPCTLCVLDRYLLILMSFIFFIIVISKRGFIFKTLNGTNLLLCVIGVISTIRHIWLQVFKDETALDGFGCGGGFFYYISTLPLLEAIKNIFNNPTPCNDVKWQLFGLSIPMYTFILFLILIIIILKMFKSQKNVYE